MQIANKKSMLLCCGYYADILKAIHTTHNGTYIPT